MKKPHSAILRIWRIYLLAAIFVPAFLSALFFEIRSPGWLLATSAWVVPFMGMYLWYLPCKLRKLSYGISEGQIVKHSGVFVTRTITMPLESVQYTTVFSNPLGRLWKVGSLLVVAAGGTLLLPGLELKDAQAFSEIILYG